MLIKDSKLTSRYHFRYLPFYTLTMIRTILLLILTLVVLPVFTFYYDQPLTPDQAALLQTLLYLMLGVALTCFTVSEITRNYSQVDKLWGLVPIVYVGYLANSADWSPRFSLMFGIVTLWGLRLSYNFSRRGGFSWRFWSGEEDYRWSVLRQTPALASRWRWVLFNLFFISLYQNGLILLFTLPGLVAFAGADTPLNSFDALATLLFLGFVTLETIADQQQYTFQTKKYQYIQSGQAVPEPYAKGFVDSGLWAWVRHPNYAAEQGIWLSFYLFSVAATDRYLNWSLAGALLLLMLFQGSADFSEKISAGKYPTYTDYIRRVPRFWPRWGRKQEPTPASSKEAIL